MMKLLIFVGMTVGSGVGWWMGEQISDDMTWALLLSSVGTLGGIWGGWWIARKNEL